MTRHPIDLPDEPRPSIGDAYRVYPATRPTPRQTLLTALLVIGGALLVIGALASWAVQ